MPSFRKTEEIPFDEQIDLLKRWRDHGDIKALNRVAESYLGYVKKIVYTEFGKKNDLEDLIQEGFIGLVKGLKTFDIDRGLQITTYVHLCIRGTILNYIMKNHGPVRLGTTGLERKIYFNFSKAKRELWNKIGQEPSNDQVAEAFGVKVEQIEDLLPRIFLHDVALDAQYEDRQPLEIASDEMQADERLTEKDRYRKLRKILKKFINELPPREQVIAKKRLLNKNTKTYREIGIEIDVSYERVRQLEVAVLKKLRRRLVMTGIVSEI